MAEAGWTDELRLDPRYTLANERTLLAWSRTALAFVAAGLAIIQFFDEVGMPAGRWVLGLALILLGSVVALASGRQWQIRETSMRAGRPIPTSHLGWLVAGGVVATGVGAAAFAALDLVAS